MLSHDQMMGDARGADRARRLYAIRREHASFDYTQRIYEVREIIAWDGTTVADNDDRARFSSADFGAAYTYAAILAEDAADYGREYDRQFGIWTWNRLTCRMAPPTRAVQAPTREER